MTSRRQFLARSTTAAFAAALVPVADGPARTGSRRDAPDAGAVPETEVDAAERRRRRNEFMRYATLAAAAQAVRPPEG